MTNPRPILPIVAAVLLGGAAAHAGELTLGGAHLIAEAGVQAAIDVNVNFTDRGHTLRETAEGGDASATKSTRDMRGADAADTSEASSSHHARPDLTPAAKPSDSPSATTDSPHGVSISPSTTIRRPSYRWQSLVPGTIK
jgi:hypothetical protein